MSRFSDWSSARLTGLHAQVRRLPGGEVTWRVLVIIVGTVLTVGGLALVPLPGPGWLIVFLGLTVLASEFVWAERLLRFARARVSAVTSLVAAQRLWVRAILTIVAAAFVVAVLAGYCYWQGWWPFSS